MTDAVLEIDRLRDWTVLREVRLRSLEESPDAFTAHLHVEAGWGESEWRELLAARTWVAARDQQHGVIGIACLVPGTRHVESVWVAPGHRRRGVLRELVREVQRIARVALRASELRLWVMDDNVVAQRAYDRLGFEPTGERQPVRGLPGPLRHEVRLRLAI